MARSPLFYGERIIGEVIDGTEEMTYRPEDQILMIRLTDLSLLVHELMKADLAFFSINPLPSQQGTN